MDRALIACQWVLAAGVIGTLAVAVARGRVLRPWTAVGLAAVAVTNLATVARPPDAGTPSAPWLVAAMVAWLVVLTTFPSGRPVPSWIRWIVGPAGAVIVGSLVLSAGEVVRAAAFVVAFAVGAGGQVWRFRQRSSIAERQATKWLLVGLVPAATMFVGMGLVVATTRIDPAVFHHPWYELASAVGIWLVPVTGAVGLASSDHAPVDAVLRSVLVASGATVAIAWVYFSLLPTVGPTWSAAAVAILAIPTASVLRRLATGLVYGRVHGSPVVLLERTLTTAVPEQDVATVVATTVAEALDVPYVAVRFDDATATQAGNEPEGPDPAPEVFPVEYRGALVAEIMVAPRAGEHALSGRDRRLLARLAASAGPALHGAATLRELARAREQLVHSREEERRRLRRDLHDDLAPTLAGLGMRAAAAAALGGSDDARAQRLHDEVQTGLQAAIGQVRQIAYDLRPPMLDDLGLEAAIRERLGTAVDPALRIDVEITDLPPTLPAAIELATLRIVQEAVTNVRRHASATTCRVRIVGADRHVEISVVDDGRGIRRSDHRGVGLLSLEERATELGGSVRVLSGPTGGTSVHVRLPIGMVVAP